MSGHLHRCVNVGDIIELKAPSGNWVVPRVSPQPLILLAGGIGITPFINLLETLEDGDPLEMRLYYGNVNGDAHAFKERIAYHQTRLPNLSVYNHYRRPLSSDVFGRDYISTEYITADLISDDFITRRPRIYMCGGPDMMEAFAGGLISRGVPKFDIFSEVFKSPTIISGDEGKRFSVSFAASRREPSLWSSADGPLLNFSEKLGLSLPSGCKVGQCESCAVKIMSGKVVHLHGQEPDDPSICLTCQAIPIEDLILDA
jgi:ferredoxin-NADP reductase